jgi:hypothetical protein
MLGLLRKKVQEEPIVQPPPKKPLALVPHTKAIQLGTYESLAGELGFMPAQLLEEQIMRFLAEEGIPVYNFTEVDKYLTYMARREDSVWIWRPLRERDKPQGWQWNGHDENWSRENSWRGHDSYRPEWPYRPYDKAVPIRILRDVKKIQDRFRDSVLFFVSDYAVPNPDPFIMVTALDVHRIVFGVWDEPSFGVPPIV